MWGFIGIFVLCCGVYALYSFVMMKVKGEVNASILLGKDYTYKKCKDKEAYIAKTAPAAPSSSNRGRVSTWLARCRATGVSLEW